MTGSSAALEELLEALIVEHERLLALARAHRDAVGAADAAAIASCIREQNAVVQRIATLETRRMALITPASRGTPTSPPTLATLVASLPIVARDRIAALGERLRTIIAAIRREHAVLRAAAEALALHMDGLMRQIGRRLSQAATYSRPGMPDVPAPMASALDLTS